MVGRTIDDETKKKDKSKTNTAICGSCVLSTKSKIGGAQIDFLLCKRFTHASGDSNIVDVWSKSKERWAEQVKRRSTATNCELS